MAQQEAFSSHWQKLTKGSVSDLCGRAPASHGYLTWCYASHYVTASHCLLIVAMNYWSTVTFGSSEHWIIQDGVDSFCLIARVCCTSRWLILKGSKDDTTELHTCLMHGDRQCRSGILLYFWQQFIWLRRALLFSGWSFHLYCTLCTLHSLLISPSRPDLE